MRRQSNHGERPRPPRVQNVNICQYGTVFNPVHEVQRISWDIKPLRIVGKGNCLSCIISTARLQHFYCGGIIQRHNIEPIYLYKMYLKLVILGSMRSLTRVTVTELVEQH